MEKISRRDYFNSLTYRYTGKPYLRSGTVQYRTDSLCSLEDTGIFDDNLVGLAY